VLFSRTTLSDQKVACCSVSSWSISPVFVGLMAAHMLVLHSCVPFVVARN